MSRSVRMTLATAAGCLMAMGCKDLTRDPGLPAGTPDPATYNSAEGALGMRVTAVYQLNKAIPQYLLETGLLSDELVDRAVGSIANTSGLGVPDPLDERLLPEDLLGAADGRGSYARLQNVRGAVNVALGALATYDTAPANQASQRILRGELYALEGYAEILLADFFCSGVPLSTLDYKQDFTYRPSSSSAQVYSDARFKLDSALVLSVGNDSVLNMARVLKGRAQLALGNYTAAADDVALVPTTFQYRLTIQLDPLSLASSGGGQIGTVGDREGRNGLPFISSGDPRSAVTVTCNPADGNVFCPIHPLTMPAKYFAVRTPTGYAPFVVANGIEARLIEAEAALQTNPGNLQWLAILNTLRTTCTSTASCSDPAPAGTGGVSGLAPLVDSGATQTTASASAAARVAELFQERAYWLFLTGHRQGDLRRLIRQYGSQPQYPQFRSDQQVYPAGVYTAPGTGQYGTDVNAPIPTTEYANPSYHGCLDRNA